jgi:hypothetical protein
MVALVKVETKSDVPRKLRSMHTKATADSWQDTGQRFHTEYRDRRFKKAHATAAGYKPRSGERDNPGSKGFKRSYTGRKLRRYGHTRPLEKSGETRRAVSMATIRSTSVSVKAAYPGARKFNFRSQYTDINMADEFRRVLPTEATSLAQTFAQSLAKHFQGNQ